MTDQTIDVRLRAQTGELKQGMDSAAQAVQQTSDRMRQAMQTAAAQMKEAFASMRTTAKSSGAGLGDAMQAARGQMQDAAIGMTGAMSGVVQSLAAIPGPAKLAVAALVSVFAAKQLADGAAKLTEGAMDLARVLGSSTNEAQKWRVALDDVGATQGELEGAAKGMSRKLRENEADLNKLGLATRDANGNLRPMTALLQDGLGVVNSYAQGADRAQMAQNLFGRGVDASSKLLLLNGEVLQSAQTTMQKYNLEVGANAVEAWKEFDAAGDETAAGMKGLGYTMGAILMPVVTDLTEAFNSTIPAAIAVLKGALGALATVFHSIKNGVVLVWETINAMVVTVAEPIRALAEAMGRALVGDFAGAANAIKGVGGVIGGAWQQAMDNMVESSMKTNNRINAIWSADTGAGKPNGQDGTKRLGPEKGKEKDKDKAAKEPSQMPVYEAEIAKRIALFEREAQASGTLRQYSRTEEAAYWKEVSDRAGVSAEDKARSEKKWRDIERSLRTEAFAVEIATLEQQKAAAENNFAERIRIASEVHTMTVAMYGAESKEAATAAGKILDERRKLAAQIVKLDEIKAQRTRELALAAIADEQQNAQMQQALGLTTKAQLLAQQADFEERMNAIKRAALLERLGLVDADADPVKKAEIEAQIEQLHTQHMKRMTEIGRQAAMEGAQPEMAVFKSMQASFEQAITGMIMQAQTLRQALDGIFKSVFSVFAQEMIAKPLAMTAARVMRESALYKALMGVQVGTQAGASGAVVALKAGETAGVVSANATQAATGAAASQSAIPVIGPALAFAAAAAMMSFVMGMGGGGKSTTTTRTATGGGSANTVPSASGGYDIPAGINPLTQLHEREMVLPQAQADAVRQMAEMGSGGGAPIVIQTTGGHFVHKNDLAKLLTAMRRDYVFQG